MDREQRRAVPIAQDPSRAGPGYTCGTNDGDHPLPTTKDERDTLVRHAVGRKAWSLSAPTPFTNYRCVAARRLMGTGRPRQRTVIDLPADHRRLTSTPDIAVARVRRRDGAAEESGRCTFCAAAALPISGGQGSHVEHSALGTDDLFPEWFRRDQERSIPLRWRRAAR
jgi:hypothetical protein